MGDSKDPWKLQCYLFLTNVGHKSVHLIALLDQNGGRSRRIDSSAHPDHHSGFALCHVLQDRANIRCVKTAERGCPHPQGKFVVQALACRKGHAPPRSVIASGPPRSAQMLSPASASEKDDRNPDAR